ncbi:MAG: aminotransferase class V-fold PLP-dependent enzyme [Thermomicrobiales bacterium]
MALGTARQDIPALAHITHLNTGGMAPLPRAVGDELVRLPNHVTEYGPGLLLAHAEELTRADWAHQQLATLLGADPDEIAFTTQFSGAVNIVVEGLPWQAGDEVVITDQEHPSLVTPLLNIARRFGVVIRRAPVSMDHATFLDGFAACLSERTRLVAASHVTTEDGTILPVEEMVRLAHERGALIFFDGAQSLGQFPVDVRALGCDFYGFVGYKWLLGPYPSAGLYIRRDLLDRLTVTWTGSRATTGGGIDMDRLEFIPGARRYEYGGRVFASDSAMAVAATFVADLDLEAIAAHAHRLAAHLHRNFARIPGVAVRSPRDPRDGTGIVTFSLEGVPGTDLAPALRERWNILTRPALNGTSVRSSVACFTDESDLDLLAEAVETVRREA